MSSITVPAKLIAGDTWSFTLVDSDHPAPTYDANIYFENRSGMFSATAADSGSDHAFTISRLTTATYIPGRYMWSVRVTDGTSGYTVATGWAEVKANPAAGGMVDHRTDARKMLDALNAYLVGNASTAQASMQLNGRAISRHSLADLVKWRDQLRTEVKTEEGGANKGLGRDMKVRLLRG